MKILKLLSLFLVFTAFVALSSCNNSSSKEKTEMSEQADKSGPEYTSAYVCPMHCEGSGSAEPGTCPVCEMAYVMNEDQDKEEDGHEGHNH